METQQVIFNLDNSEYGIDIISIKEIVRMEKVTKMPNSPPYLDGVINLRGKVIPVIDLRIRLSLPATERNDDTRIIVVNQDAKTIGLVVDKVSEVKRISDDQIESAGEMSLAISDNYIRGMAKLEEGRLITLLDIIPIFD